MSNNSGLSLLYSSHLTVFRAVSIMVLLMALILYGLVVSQPLSITNGIEPKISDLNCQQTIVERMHAGESYYSATGDVLRKMGYTTASVFNWRLPPLAWLLGKLPSLMTGKVIAFILAMTTLLVWMTVFHQNSFTFWKVFVGGILLSSPVIYSLLPGVVVAHEFWAGTLIALSLAMHARGWRYASVLAGLAALFLRELTLPFVCIMMILAYREGQRREALLWFVGVLAFGGELLIHWSIVSKLITANDIVLHGGWIAFGGWPFVLNTAQMNPFLFKCPAWITSIFVPLSLLGLAWWRSAEEKRVACTVGTYILAFMIVGRSFNIYWGLMYAFVMPLGLLHLPFVFRQLRQPFQRKKDVQKGTFHQF